MGAKLEISCATDVYRCEMILGLVMIMSGTRSANVIVIAVDHAEQSYY